MRSALSRLRAEHGFNLIELMVCLVIIGVLVTIAMPTYLGAVERADDAATHASLHTAQVAGRQVAQTDGGYDGLDVETLRDAEPSVRWVGPDEPSLGPTIVSVRVVAGRLYLAAYSPTGTCFFLRDDPSGEVGRGAALGVERADCTGTHAVVAAYEPTW